MNQIEAGAVLGYMRKLWEEWRPEPELEAMWLRLLGHFDEGQSRMIMQGVREDGLSQKKPDMRLFKIRMKALPRAEGSSLPPLPKPQYAAIRDADGRRIVLMTRGEPHQQQKAAHAALDLIADMYGGDWRLEWTGGEAAPEGQQEETRTPPPEVLTARMAWEDRDPELYESMMRLAIETYVTDPAKKSACLLSLPGQVEWLRRQKPAPVVQPKAVKPATALSAPLPASVDDVPHLPDALKWSQRSNRLNPPPASPPVRPVPVLPVPVPVPVRDDEIPWEDTA